jgi:hypothetical protein
VQTQIHDTDITTPLSQPHRCRNTILPLLSLALGIIALPFALGIIPIVKFPEERIDLRVENHAMEVRALYTYTNPWSVPVVQGFVLPLPVDSGHPYPFPIKLIQAATGKEIPLRDIGGTMSFEVWFAAGETVPVALYYRQEAPLRNARYILTTTRPWRKPLRRGTYRVEAAGAANLQSNYSLAPDGKDKWIWERRDFMPEADWQLSWRGNEQ